MEQALYGPDGYYTNFVRIGGESADFVTAAHSPLFGYTLANYISRQVDIWGRPSHLAVVEVGAGEGALAEHIITGMGRRVTRDVRVTYHIVEPSPALRLRQAARISAALAQLGSSVVVSWAESLTEQGQVPLNIPTVLVANEVLDALPVERFRRTNNGWERACVVDDPADRHEKRGHRSLTWAWEPAPTSLAVQADRWLPIPVGTCAELAPTLSDFIRSCAGVTVGPLAALFIDYGITREELAAGVRAEGTLRGYRQHHVTADVLSAVGLQDITADVHWEFTEATARMAGFTAVLRQQQGRFLMEHGILNVLAELQRPSGESLAAYQLAGAFKQLCLPGGMGERFEVLECQRPSV